MGEPLGYRALARRGEIAAELSRREFLRRTTVLGAGAIVASALPAAQQLIAADPALADVPFDGATLQAYADTIIPGRKVARTELGDEVHPQAIAGVDDEPGAVETDALRLYRHPLIGFDALAPLLLADLSARALARGGTFLSLGYDKRVEILLEGFDFNNPTRLLLYEAGAAVPFTAFCAAALHRDATAAKAGGYRVMGHPGTAPNGYRRFSYGRKLAKERTKRGNLP